MDINDLLKQIKETKSIKNKGERLEALRDITEVIANDFTESMAYLEEEIAFVLERTPNKIKEELGYDSVSDVTQDISVRASFEY